MHLSDYPEEIQEKKQLLERHQRNLKFLKNQAAHYGVTELPLAIHNALTHEQDAIVTLERDLVTLGASPEPNAVWQAAVMDSDPHWRDILVKYIIQLGGNAIEPDTLPVNRADLIDSCAMAIVGVSAQSNASPERAAALIEVLVNFATKLPLIFLADMENRDLPIVLRQTAHEYNIQVMPVTIFKENFTYDWFSRVVHRTLTR